MIRRLAVLDAPSNLGLRPPEPGVAPGVYKLAGALRDAGIVAGIGAHDAGVVTPPRYRPDWQPGAGTRNADAIATYSRTLADRIARLLDDDAFPVVLGGDCSIVLGSALALRRRGRYGLAYLDGHGDFRHPGNAPVQAVGGEALAVVTGRGDERLLDLDGLGQLVREQDAVAVGLRPGDEELAALQAVGITAVTADAWAGGPATDALDQVMATLGRDDLDGFWIHLDVDILDASVLPAVDSPDPGGLDYDQLRDLLAALVGSQRAVGLDVCIYDPDLDPTGEHAGAITRCLVGAFDGAVS